jgi:hypothetical protein
MTTLARASSRDGGLRLSWNHHGAAAIAINAELVQEDAERAIADLAARPFSAVRRGNGCWTFGPAVTPRSGRSVRWPADLHASYWAVLRQGGVQMS